MRVWIPYTEWECVKAGMYDKNHSFDTNLAKEAYREFLSNIDLFNESISRVFLEWPNSCLHFLSNTSMNRIAWIGQSSMCMHSGIPCFFRAGYNLLSDRQKYEADATAGNRLKEWEHDNAIMIRLFSSVSKTFNSRCQDAKSMVEKYEEVWLSRGYKEIPESVPEGINDIAPSYKTIALSLLKNDINGYSLGFSRPKSYWYGVLKREEIMARSENRQTIRTKKEPK